MAGEKLCLWSSTFFSRNTSDWFCFLKIIIRVVFCSNIFTKYTYLKIYLKIVSHAWLKIAPLGKSICLLRQWRIQQLLTWFSHWIVLMTKMIFYPKKIKYYSESKIWRHFSPATIAGYPKLNCFFSAYPYFCITCYSDRRLTTINFKELFYLMPFFAFVLL